MVGVKKALSVLGLTAFSAVYAADWYATDPRFGGHDPSIVRHEDGYAMILTNTKLQMLSSEDARTWKTHDRLMNSFPQWILDATGNQIEDIWAPDLYYFGGEYRVYYTGSAFGKNTSGIGFLGSKSIVPGSADYKWTDYGEVVRSTTSNNYNAIDADIIRDNDGKYWLTFGSFWDGIRLVEIDEQTGKRKDNQIYSIASRGGSGIEGPSLIEHNGQYFLFTAWDVCCKMGSMEEVEKATYKTAVGRADNITGPYLDKAGKRLYGDKGGTILLERYGRYYGPGGGEAFKDLNRIRFVHHYYDTKAAFIGAPTIHVRDVVFTDDNWPEMGQPFIGRYLSAEAEHGIMTRGVSGDLVISYSNKSSNGEYVAYINTSGSVIHLPMNIMQAGDYMLRYRYANGGDEASHNVAVNGQNTEVILPATGAYGEFGENAFVLIPAKLKRGSNFIDVKVGKNFAELDRIDFLRVIRDTIPGNGFDNGIRVRLDGSDKLAIKNGGYALYENIIMDSIVSNSVFMQTSATNGKINIRLDSKTGTIVSTCDLSKKNADGLVQCSDLTTKKGIYDLYLTAESLSGEITIGNIYFKDPNANAVRLTQNGAGSINQTVAQGSAIEEFYYTVEGATSASVSGLPEGISGTMKGSELHISGTVSQSAQPGAYAFTVKASEGNVTSTGTITVTIEKASKINASHPLEFNGFEAETTNAGFEEDGYINFANELESFGIWEIESEKAGELYLAIRYANGGNAARNMNLSVNNGAAQEVVFNTTGAWTTWEEAIVRITLNKGINTIKLTSITTDGGPNIDMFYFSESGIKISELPPEAIAITKTLRGYQVQKIENGFNVHFDKAGNYRIYIFDALGQKILEKHGYMNGDVRIENLGLEKNFIRVIKMK